MTDPWSGLELPKSEGDVSARRVSATDQWDFYWGFDSKRRPHLLLRTRIARPLPRWPVLRGIEIQVAQSESERTVAIRLLAPELREVFGRLCTDIVASSREAASESSAIDCVAQRLWLWHHLLRGGGRLSVQEQAGLWAELSCLSFIAEHLGWKAAIQSWTGPTHSTNDFAFASLAIETKSVLGNHAELVRISSEHQLAEDLGAHLFMRLYRLRQTEELDAGAFTLAEIVRLTQDRVSSDPALLDRLQQLLAAAGFSPSDDYTQRFCLGAPVSTLLVSGSFPRLTPASLPSGVRDVKYGVEISALLALPDAEGVLVTKLSGSNSVDD